jgi:hypothetical protein
VPNTNTQQARIARRLEDARASLAKYEALDAESRKQFTVRGPDGSTQWTEDVSFFRADVARYEAQLAEVSRG